MLVTLELGHPLGLDSEGVLSVKKKAWGHDLGLG